MNTRKAQKKKGWTEKQLAARSDENLQRAVAEARKIIAHNVRSIRQKRGLTQAELASKAGISVSYISNIERAKNAATLDKIVQIAKVLKVVPRVLLLENGYEDV